MKVGYQILADLQQQQAFKQWGFTNNTGRPYITFPFKFSNVFTAISCICHNGSPSEANTVYNVSISGMNIGASGGGSGKYWCAFGVAQQQWGINSAGNDGSEGESGWYAFPVNFNSACFALFCGLRNTDTNNPTNYDSEVQPRNWTTTKFNVYKQNYGGNPWFGSFIWFAIGRQPASYKL